MNSRKFATTLARGLSILRAFRRNDAGLSLAELIERTAHTPATVARMCFTLCELGYLSERDGVYYLGPSVQALATVAGCEVCLFQQAESVMADLAARTGVLVLLAVPDGASMTLIRTWEPPAFAGGRPEWLGPGNRVPLLGSSVGQAYLAILDGPRFEAIAPSDTLRALRNVGKAQLDQWGFTFVRMGERYDSRFQAVSCPLYAPSIAAPVVFGCGGLPDDLSDKRILREVGPALRDAVACVSGAGGSLS